LSWSREIAPESDRFAGLVAAVAERRDRDAFEQLFDHFAPRIHAHLLRLGAEGALAEELTQEVMTTLWHKAALFDGAKSSVATWLFRIARNRRIDQLRRSRDTRPLDLDDLLGVADDAAPADEAIDAARREVLVRQALERLPAEQLALIRLAFFQGLSHSEIAAATGLPLGTVKSRLRLAFERLRRTLETQGLDGLERG